MKAKSIIDFLKTELVLFIAVLLTFIFHEFGHWLTGEILGNKMVMTLNGCHPVSGKFLSEWNFTWVSIAGPIFTVIQSLFILYFIKRYKSIFLYPFLFFPFFMRMVTTLFSIIQPQDEAVFSSLLGLGTWTIPIMICLILLYLCWKGATILKINWKINLNNFIFSILFCIIVIAMDKMIF